MSFEFDLVFAKNTKIAIDHKEYALFRIGDQQYAINKRDELGEGGYGYVYKAYTYDPKNKELGNPHAIKFIDKLTTSQQDTIEEARNLTAKKSHKDERAVVSELDRLSSHRDEIY